MKKIGFILLMMLLPLQSGWAAVQLYHSHGSSDSLVDVVFHDHSEAPHSHSYSHDVYVEASDSTTEQSDAADHHHHFHVHTVSVLSEVNIPNFPSPSAVQHSRIPAWQETLFSQRIERPNWR